MRTDARTGRGVAYVEHVDAVRNVRLLVFADAARVFSSGWTGLRSVAI